MSGRDYILPDYNGAGLVNLMSSIVAACGGRSDYLPLSGLEQDRLDGARNVVLVVVDGLGYEYLTSRGLGSALHQHLHSRVDSVAPPTTAASVSTFLTGLAPQQHGLVGWFTWFRELGSVIKVLPFISRGTLGNLAEAGVTPQALYGLKSVYDGLKVESYSLTPDWLGESPYNHALLGPAELVLHSGMDLFYSEIQRLVRAHDRRKFIYAYWPSFDGIAHNHGVESNQVFDHFQRLDAGFDKLIKQLAGTDTLVLLTADHGFVDAPPERRLVLNNFPDIADCLQVPLCGEPRLAYCYPRHDKRDEFVERVGEQLADMATLYKGADLIDQGLFGPGDPHPELHSRVGEFVLMMKENYVLTQQLPGEAPLNMVGYHGGLSSAEVYVPLVAVSC